MTLQELKTFLESADGKTEEVTAYLRGLFPADLKAAQAFADTAEEKAGWIP